MAMGTDASNLWVVALLVELAILIVVCAIWCWHRWGWRQAWIVFVPVGLLLSVYLTDSITNLLPNLM
jgi:hypothetical protein